MIFLPKHDVYLDGKAFFFTISTENKHPKDFKIA